MEPTKKTELPLEDAQKIKQDWENKMSDSEDEKEPDELSHLELEDVAGGTWPISWN